MTNKKFKKIRTSADKEPMEYFDAPAASMPGPNSPQDPLYGIMGTLNIDSPNYIYPWNRVTIDYVTNFGFLLFALIGIFANGLILLVTIRHKSMQNNCNYFIALNALTDLICETNAFTAIYAMFTNQWICDVPNAKTCQTKIVAAQCFIVCIPAMIAYICSFMLIFIISADRLFAILFPILYREVSPRIYVGGIFLLCVFYSMALVWLGWQDRVVTNPMAIHQCIFHSITGMGWFGSTLLFYNIIAFVCSAILCYALIGLIMIRKNSSLNGDETTKRLFKSLVVILTVLLIGWMANQVMRIKKNQILQFFGLSTSPTMESFIISVVSKYLLNLSQCCNAPILYLCSKDYRQTMRQEFRKISYIICPWKIMCMPNQQVAQMMNNHHQHVLSSTNTAMNARIARGRTTAWQ